MYTFSKSIFKIDKLQSQLKQPCPGKRLVLFGAGGWGEALLKELEIQKVSLPVVFTDNDPTKHGMALQNRPIILPQELNKSLDIVVITTLSAGDQIAKQLETLGFDRNVNYFEVMRKFDPVNAFAEIDLYNKYVDSFEGCTILHIGPGGNLGAEILLNAQGAKFVTSVEYNSFRLSYPDVTPAIKYYKQLAEKMKQTLERDPFKEEIIINESGRNFMNADKISLLYPCSVTSLPIQDETFDVALHQAVFEHVSNPQKGYEEIFRVLKPGGVTVGLVDPQDHRTFSSSKDYYPLKFLEYSRENWYKISSKINFHNQVTAPEHKKMISDAGFSIDKWDNLMEMEVTEELWQKFNPMFHEFNREELGVLRFAFTASKP